LIAIGWLDEIEALAIVSGVGIEDFANVDKGKNFGVVGEKPPYRLGCFVVRRTGKQAASILEDRVA
jgi:hypothetical protein